MKHTVLVPFELPDAEMVPEAIVDVVSPMEVVVLGHFGLPEQTPPSVGRDQFEADAQTELDELSGTFERAGASVTSRLVFGKDRAKTIDRIAVEEECEVILTPGVAASVGSILVPLRGEDSLDAILPFVGELVESGDASVTLFHATTETDRRPGEQILADATDRLTAEGIDPDRIGQRLVEDRDPRDAIVEAAEAFDVLVLGETEPTIRDIVFGDLPAGITALTDDPTFVVRNPEKG